MILGIDPGYGLVGFAVIENRGKEKLLDMGVIITDSKQSFPERLCIIRQELRSIINQYTITESAVEDLFFSVNKKTALKVAHARGVILEELYDQGINIFEYSPSQIKKSVTGHSKSNKATIIEMVKKFYHIEFKQKYDDAYDALAIAFTHRHSLRY